MSNSELSRAISHALRHEPWLYELELDEQGWTSIESLLSALQMTEKWRTLGRSDILNLVAGSQKKRHEVSNDNIRALYGHSIAKKIIKTPRYPPELLFHGTSPDAAHGILANGLRPMNRQYVHLSTDRKDAIAVGLRKAERPVILLVDARLAASEGTPFYRGNERVWLADFISKSYLSEDS